jgi:sugar lactone lactonase YvrE
MFMQRRTARSDVGRFSCLGGVKNWAMGWREGILLIGLLALASGCTSVKQAAAPSPIFYPPAPDPPRLQFLMGFSGEGDLRGNSDAFKTFVVGKAPPKRPISKPYGLALRSNQLYVCDTVLRLLEIIDLDKRQLRYFSPEGAGRLRTPINVTVDQDGTRYVTDTSRHQVLIYRADDTFAGAIGREAPRMPQTTGSHLQINRAEEAGAADLWTPTDVAVSADRLYITDLKSHSVQVYNKADRRLLFAIPAGEANATNRLYAPTNLALDAQGRLYVSDTGGFRVQQYDANGQHLRSFGSQGLAPGTFALPKGIAVDRAGRLYVVDARTQVVQIFNDQGQLLMYFGEPGQSRAALNLPAKIIIDYDHVAQFQKCAAPGFVLEHLVLITNQYGERKVSIYGFGHRQ